MDLNNILYENYDYFSKEVEPYYFILYTMNNKAIVIEVKDENFAHLLGFRKSSNVAISSSRPLQFYNNIKDKRFTSIFDMINEERFNNNELTLEESFIYNKNIHFIELFESLINGINLRLYRKQPGDDFDADYLHLKKYAFASGYIAIIGSDKSDLHYFNSVLYETNRYNQYKGVEYKIKRVERILKKDFDKSKYEFIKSKRFKESKTQKHEISQTKPFNYKKNKNRINSLLPSEIKINTGLYKKNSVQIYKDGNLIESNFEKTIQSNSIDEIVNIIKTKYL